VELALLLADGFERGPICLCRLGDAGPKRLRFVAQLGVGQRRGRLFQGVDLPDEGPEPLQLAIILRSDDFLDQSRGCASPSIR
jgi:hypothetical protein